MACQSGCVLAAGARRGELDCRCQSNPMQLSETLKRDMRVMLVKTRRLPLSVRTSALKEDNCDIQDDPVTKCEAFVCVSSSQERRSTERCRH
jgi:hypothetical protein